MNNCNFAHAIVLITPVQFLLIANYNKKRFPLKHRSYIECRYDVQKTPWAFSECLTYVQITSCV